MSKNTTTYTVLNAEGVIAEGITKKAKAVELADSNRGASPVEVVTGAGNVVHTVPPFKKIKMIPAYTREVALPEGVVVPDGKRVAYDRKKFKSAILHDAETGEYSILRYDRGVEIVGFATTRAAGKHVLTLTD